MCPVNPTNPGGTPPAPLSAEPTVAPAEVPASGPGTAPGVTSGTAPGDGFEVVRPDPVVATPVSSPPTASLPHPPPPDSEPRLKDGAEGTFEKIEGPAFVDGASYLDVDQGSIGDCWMMAGLSAVAAARPEALENMIRPNDDGTFTVVLKEKARGSAGRRGRYVDHLETVRPTFPKGVQYADPTPRQKTELWVALIEKAYAQWKGNSYENLVGGRSNEMMSAVLGAPNRRHSFSATADPGRIFEKISDALADGHPVTAGTPKRDDIESPIKGHHGYAIIGAYEKDGEQRIKLYNPWGANDTDRDMTVDIPVDKLLRNFSYYAVCQG